MTGQDWILGSKELDSIFKMLPKVREKVLSLFGVNEDIFDKAAKQFVGNFVQDIAAYYE